ncbi:MAG: hypothetical protein GC139_00585 [Sideroxydans sp.]|nr:hypothetical protein [Sideroxydans sp.]
MDSKVIFVRTSEGEAEISRRTNNLSGDIKRALLLVDGKSTVDEVLKHAAPSLRPSMGAMLKQLLGGGYIQDKASVKASAGPKMATPKMAVPAKKVENEGMELDFTTIMRAPTPEVLAAEAEKAKARAEAETQAKQKAASEAKARAEIEAAKARAEAEAKALAEAQAKAKREAEAARLKAEQEAAKAREEAEALRLKAEQEAAKARAEIEAAKAKAEAEAKALAEAQAKAKREAEAARLKAEQEAAKARAEAEAAKAREALEAEAERVKQAEQAARIEAEAAAEQARIKQEEESKRSQQAAKARAEFDMTKLKTGQGAARSTIATVLFFDVVGYTKLPVARQIDLKGQFNELVSEFIKELAESQRIILDTGDGAAIGFLQHPEDALDVAMKFRAAVTANQHRDYPELNVRIGIHLGPVNVVKDMNGQFNMVGDGINDAQRIMSFAGTDQIYVSRSYFDVVSRLTAEYAGLFRYRGVQKDKHGREHQVYQVMDERAAAEQTAAKAAEQPDLNLEPIALNGLADLAISVAAETMQPVPKAEAVPDKSPEQIAAEERAAAQRKAQEEEIARKQAEAQARAEAERRAREEEAARKLADDQAKAWADAEKRAKVQAEAQARNEQAEPAVEQVAAVAPKKSRVRRKPLPVGKIAAGLLVLVLVLVVVLPYIWPMQGYVLQVEKRLSAQLRQPVHIGKMSATLLPSPQLELHEVTVGNGRELKAGTVVLHFDFTALLSDTRAINNAELNNLQLDDASFDKTLSWLEAAAGDAHYPLARMTLRGARVNSELVKLPAINGNVEFDAQGHFSKAVLGSEDGKLNLQLHAQPGQQLGLELSLKESELPILPYVHFNELNAQGQLRDGEMNFSDFDARLYGGTLVGNARLNWQKGWLMQGHMTVKSLEMHDAFPAARIEGELDGNAGYSIQADKLALLGGNPSLDGSFSLKKGALSDMDMVETVRLAGRDGDPGGRTHFDELSGRLQLENGIQRYRQLRLAAGVLSASGYLDIDTSRELNGHFLADLKVRAGSVPLLLTGKVGEPVLRAAR